MAWNEDKTYVGVLRMDSIAMRTDVCHEYQSSLVSVSHIGLQG